MKWGGEGEGVRQLISDPYPMQQPIFMFQEGEGGILVLLLLHVTSFSFTFSFTLLFLPFTSFSIPPKIPIANKILKCFN